MTLPNGEEAKVEGINEMKLSLHDGQIRKLGEVRYVPSLKRNLISVGRLDGLGYTVILKNGGLEVTKGDSVILKARKNKKNLFMLDGEWAEEALVRGEASSSEGRCRMLDH